MFLRYILLFPIQFLLNILTYIVAFPLALLSVLLGVDKLPYPLSLFHTHDDTMDGGQHQKGWPKVTGFKLVMQRTRWMWRNPAYGFAAYWFGFPHAGVVITKHGWTASDKWDSNENAYEYYTMEQGGKKYFSFRAQLHYTSKRHIKLWFGWHFDDKGTGFHMLKFNLNPFKPNA